MTIMPITPIATKITERISHSIYKGIKKDSVEHEKLVPCISFHDYMDICLYDEVYGYYRAGAIRVGKEGDFYTSSAVGNVMGEVIAQYALTYSKEQNKRMLLGEWGAGTGTLSAAISSAGYRLNKDWEDRFHSVLIENHSGHVDAVQNSFQKVGINKIPAVLSSEQLVESANEWFTCPYLFIANELLDAFPVHRVMKRGGKFFELGVAYSEGEGFYYVQMELTNSCLSSWLERDGILLYEGQVTEICPRVVEWLNLLASLTSEGRLLLIDYGHEAEEYSAEHRMEGTLMTYSKHRASDSPFERPGEQDITAHVSFTFVRRSAEEAGFNVVYFDTQKQFLIDYGALSLLRDHDGKDPFSDTAKRNRAIRQLLLSDGMSESFKVMILEKKGS
ncbi:SAM-dependent methyltransferase [Paenibacillus sp. GSMTC-2017]|uniref:class I SAM-dependent methyltransferase n=1 Tax=Paenibacillus sp. GSMTC-2017 TaxID=2794350 RepID=UPI0018D9DCC1|nr:SAM-dependent methyltransferase [Paenibacillus sp. GSMTC-2017]MBH5316919.1 SAM-dependent methyltransferase [Paenibacillus sp. GSMTC-2017]